MVVKGPENKELRILIDRLSRAKRPFWRYVAELLAKPKRRRIAVNISKIARYAKEGSTVVVPGKVLGDGNLDFSVVVVAYAFSKSAKEKIEKAGGKVLRLKDFFEERVNKPLSDVILLR